MSSKFGECTPPHRRDPELLRCLSTVSTMNLEKPPSGNHLCWEKIRQDFQISRTTRAEVLRPRCYQRGGKALLLLGGWATRTWYAKARPCYVEQAHDPLTYAHGFAWELRISPHPWKSKQYWMLCWSLSTWLVVRLAKNGQSPGRRSKSD